MGYKFFSVSHTCKHICSSNILHLTKVLIIKQNQMYIKKAHNQDLLSPIKHETVHLMFYIINSKTERDVSAKRKENVQNSISCNK